MLSVHRAGHAFFLLLTIRIRGSDSVAQASGRSYLGDIDSDGLGCFMMGPFHDNRSAPPARDTATCNLTLPPRSQTCWSPTIRNIYTNHLHTHNLGHQKRDDMARAECLSKRHLPLHLRCAWHVRTALPVARLAVSACFNQGLGIWLLPGPERAPWIATGESI